MAIRTILGALYSVVAYKKKMIAFLVALTLGSGATMVCCAQSPADQPVKPLFGNSGSRLVNDPNLSAAPTGGINTRELFFKMMFSVLLVIILGAAAIYTSKKFLPRFTNLPGKRIRVIETVHLGPRKTVHLLEIANQQLLIGSTDQNITKLADVTDVLSETDFSETETNNN